MAFLQRVLVITGSKLNHKDVGGGIQCYERSKCLLCKEDLKGSKSGIGESSNDWEVGVVFLRGKNFRRWASAEKRRVIKKKWGRL